MATPNRPAYFQSRNNPAPAKAPVKKAAPKPAPKPQPITPRATQSAPTPIAPNYNIGFDPAAMAKTLTDLGFDTDIQSLQAAMTANQGNMDKALADLHAWTQQTRGQFDADQQKVAQSYAQAAQQQGVSDANIAQLFGGAQAGEAQANAQPGENLLGAQQAADSAFAGNVGAILNQQGADYARDIQGSYGAKAADLQNQLSGLQKEKGQAYSKNLLDLMNVAWGRQQDLAQQQLAQQNFGLQKQQLALDTRSTNAQIRKQNQDAALAKAAFDQAQKLAPLDIAGKKADIRATNARTKAQLAAIGQQQKESILQATIGAQKVKLNQSQLEAAKIANKTAMARLKAAQAKTGFNLNDPNTRASLASAAVTDVINKKRGTLVMDPRVAWQSVLNTLQNYNLVQNPVAVQTAWNAFSNALSRTHAAKMWMAYYIDPGDFKLKYDPTRRLSGKPPTIQEHLKGERSQVEGVK